MSEPTPLTSQEMTMFDTSSSAPTAEPPATTGEMGVTAWQNDKRVTALWSIAENRNSWVHINGVGWRKLANNHDSAVVALTILSAHAKEGNRVYNYREESDNMIHEVYVW